MPKSYTFEILVDVHCDKQLKKMAEARYIEKNRRPESAWVSPQERKRMLADWKAIRSVHRDPVCSDLMMLLEPRSVPACVSIQDTHAIAD